MPDTPVYQDHLNAAVERIERAFEARTKEIRADMRDLNKEVQAVQIEQALQRQDINQIKSTAGWVAAGIATAVSGVCAAALSAFRNKLFGA